MTSRAGNGVKTAGPSGQRTPANKQDECQSELQVSNSNKQQQQSTNSGLHQSSDHLDSGYAWFILVAMFLLMSTIGGTSRVLGLIYAEQVSCGYYGREEASWPIASASTVENLVGILTPALAGRLSWRQIELLSSVLLVAAFLGGYLSNSLLVDILCLGLIQGVALSMSTVLSLAVNNDYFERFRTSAYGILMSGSTFGILYMGPLVEWVLERNPGEKHRVAYLAIGSFYLLNVGLSFFVVPRAQCGKLAQFLGLAPKKTQTNGKPPIAKGLSGEPDRKQSVRSRRLSVLESHIERKISIVSISANRELASWSRNSFQVVAAAAAPYGGQPAMRLAASGIEKAPRVAMNLNSSAVASNQAATSRADLESAVNSSTTYSREKYEPPATVAQQKPAANEQAGLSWPLVWQLIRTPYLQCAWIMLALYYLVARTMVMIMVDLAHDHGLEATEAASLLNFWSLGELVGRLLLGSLIDLRWLRAKWCIALTCAGLAGGLGLMLVAQSFTLLALSVTLVAALVSLEYMLINVFIIDYLGQDRVTLAYPLASLISALVLFARPPLIGLFRDHIGSYDGLLALLAAVSLGYATLLVLLEPLMVRIWSPPST